MRTLKVLLLVLLEMSSNLKNIWRISPFQVIDLTRKVALVDFQIANSSFI
jgi:hypothetical protein